MAHLAHQSVWAPPPPPATARHPKLFYGTAWRKEKTRELVLMALRYGFRGLDTAAQPSVYDEAGLGEALYVSDKLPKMAAGDLKRSVIWLQTKFVPPSEQDENSSPYDPSAPVEEQVAQSVAFSLRNLRTTYLDCLLLSQPYASHEETLAAWRAMESQVEAGHALSLGISNLYDLEGLERLWADATIKPRVLQNKFSQAGGFDTPLRIFCAQKSIQYQAYGAITANQEVIIT